MTIQFKKGNMVELISKKELIYEESNWIEQEKSNPQIGDIFTVKEASGAWIDLEELTFSHPAEKFILVKG